MHAVFFTNTNLHLCETRKQKCTCFHLIKKTKCSRTVWNQHCTSLVSSCLNWSKLSHFYYAFSIWLYHLNDSLLIVPANMCFFVSLVFFVPRENFLLVWRSHHCRRRAANVDLCVTLITVEQWEFFSVSHLMWQGASVYDGLRSWGLVTLTPNAERLEVELSLPVLTT